MVFFVCGRFFNLSFMWYISFLKFPFFRTISQTHLLAVSTKTNDATNGDFCKWLKGNEKHLGMKQIALWRLLYLLSLKNFLWDYVAADIVTLKKWTKVPSSRHYERMHSLHAYTWESGSIKSRLRKQKVKEPLPSTIFASACLQFH